MPRTETFTVSDLTEHDQEHWRDLERRALFRNPFQVPGFLLPAMRELATDSVGLLVSRDPDGSWLACLPIQTARRWHRVPLLGTTLWSHVYCYLGVPLVDRSRAEEAVISLIGGMRKGAFAGFDLIPSDGSFRTVFDSALGYLGARNVTFDRFERAGLIRKDGSLLLPFKKKRRYELNRLERRLSDQVDTEVTLRTCHHDTQAIEDFLRLESAGWKGKQGTALASAPSHASFFRAIAHHFIATNSWRTFSLEADGLQLAMLTAVVADDTLYEFKIAFDERYSRFSPGVLLHRATMRLLDKQGEIMVVDTCAYPTNETANRLYPDRIPFETIALPAHGLSGRASAVILRLAAAMKQRRQAARKD